MGDHRWTLAPKRKTEALLITGGRKKDRMSFILNDTRIVPSRTVKYLGTVFDEKRNFGQHVVAVATKAEGSLAAIGRFLPNIGGSGSGKRGVLCGALHNIFLYGLPIWIKCFQDQEVREPAHLAQEHQMSRGMCNGA